jgi:ribonuclease Z
MFTATLVNDPFGDPGLYVEFKYRSRALLFDLGDLHHLPPRKLIKISHIFVSHTHMDHFIGFDYLLRICLGRNQHICLFGPPGFQKQLENKLGAYTWNLVENYTNDFDLLVTEIHKDHQISKRYACRNAFRPELIDTDEAFTGTIVDNPLFIVKAAFLDHKISCLAFRFEEKKRINIKKNGLQEMGLPTGAWLMDLKDKIANNADDGTPIQIKWKDNQQSDCEKIIPLGELKDKIVKITQGGKISYITDVIYHEENARRIIELAWESDMLFIESTFLHKDIDIAQKKYHLTAFQAGELARKAKVKRLILFHFSPKYKGSEFLLFEEAQKAYTGNNVLFGSV